MTGMTVMKNVQSFVCMYVQIHDSALEVCDVHLFFFLQSKDICYSQFNPHGACFVGTSCFCFPLVIFVQPD